MCSTGITPRTHKKTYEWIIKRGTREHREATHHQNIIRGSANQRSYPNKQTIKKLGTGRGQIDLIIVEDLECVIQDRLDDTDLPCSVGDAAAGISAHEGGSVAKISESEFDNILV